jgi:hypothetical protein
LEYKTATLGHGPALSNNSQMAGALECSHSRAARQFGALSPKYAIGHKFEVCPRSRRQALALGRFAYRSEDASNRGANQMTKFYALIAACALFAPMAFATLNQAAQIVA